LNRDNAFDLISIHLALQIRRQEISLKNLLLFIDPTVLRRGVTPEVMMRINSRNAL
jgi:hypothetical protein